MAQTIVLRNNPAYKEGSLLGYDLNSQSRFNPVPITLSRDSEAYVEKNGVLTRVNPEVPRIDSDGALLVEPQRTNLLLRSEDFTTTWSTAASATVTGNTTTAPDGATTADTISLAAVTDSRVTQTFTLANSTTYTLSCFFKNDSLTAGQTFDFRIVNNTVAPNNFQMIATVDLAAGSVVISESGTAGTGISGTATGGIESYGNGWYRVFVTATTGSGAGTASATVEIISSNARQFFAWGAQLESASYATSYIKTEGATATRSADVVSQTGLANLLGDAEGSFYIEGSWFEGNGGAWITLNDDSQTNRIFIFPDTGTNQARFGNTVSGVTSGSVQNASYTIATDGTFYKIAGRYSLNDLAAYIDGNLIGTDSTVGIYPDNTLTTIKLNAGIGNLPFYGKIKALAVYDTALDNTELANITTNGI